MDPIKHHPLSHVPQGSDAHSSEKPSLATSPEIYTLPKAIPSHGCPLSSHEVRQLNIAAALFLISGDSHGEISDKLPPELQRELLSLYTHGVLACLAEQKK